MDCGVDLDVNYATVSALHKESTSWLDHQFKISIEDLYTGFFCYLKSLLDNIKKEEIDCVALSVFVNSLPVQNMLRKAMRNIGVSKCDIIAKSVAAILPLTMSSCCKDYESHMLSVVLNDGKSEKNDTVKNAISAEYVIEHILPVIDSLELGIKMLTLEERKSKLGEGMIKIHKKWLDIINKIDLIPIAAEGTVFDPHVHNAVFHVNDSNFGENMIVEELQKGYWFEGKLLRCSQVKVAN